MQSLLTMVFYYVSGKHLTRNPKYDLENHLFRTEVSCGTEGRKYYTTAKDFGCSKDATSRENAIRMILHDEAYDMSTVKITVAENQQAAYDAYYKRN